MFTKAGWRRLRVSAGLYYNDELGTATVVHGDDFLTEGDKKELDAMDRLLAQNLNIKFLGRSAPGTTRSGSTSSGWSGGPVKVTLGAQIPRPPARSLKSWAWLAPRPRRSKGPGAPELP